MTNLIIIGDTHCGHKMAITHPDFLKKNRPETKIVTPLWEWYINELGTEKYDYVFHAGDVIDGQSRKDYSHLSAPDIEEQQDMAIAVLSAIPSRSDTKYRFVYGSPYHAGNMTDDEKAIAVHFGDKGIATERLLQIEGIRFHMSHTPGGKTTTPVGGDIAIRKQMIWNMIEKSINDVPMADFIIRAHIHEYRAVESIRQKAFSVPCMVIGNPDYNRHARRIAGGFYDLGFVTMKIDAGKVIEFKKHHFGVKIKKGYEVLR